MVENTEKPNPECEEETTTITEATSFDVKICFPQGQELVYQLNPDFTVFDLKSLIKDNFASYTCFTLKHEGSTLIDSLSIAASGFSSGSLLHLIPSPYSVKDIYSHLQTFREILTCFKSNEQHFGVDYAKSCLPVFYSDDLSTPIMDRDGLNLTDHYPFHHTPTIICLKSITFSQWSPVPQNRDLVYLKVVTLENDHLEIVGSESGFYISKSTDTLFNPLPFEKSCIDHTLSGCLSKASPFFADNFTLLKKYIASIDFRNYIPVFSGNYPWCVPDLVDPSDPSSQSQMDLVLKLTGNDYFYNSRDWNDDFQSINELPCSTPQEKVIKDQIFIKNHQEFVQFAVKGAVAIIDKTISLPNLSDCYTLEMYVYQNIFFSSGTDNRSYFDQLGGVEAAKVAVSKDIDGVQALLDANVNGVSLLDSVLIDYMGRRFIAQTIIPGILKKNPQVENPVKYGLMEENDQLLFDESFHDLGRLLAKKLHIKEHSIHDPNGVCTDFFTSVETKGILGNDNRKYFLDLYRLTPVDIVFLDTMKEYEESNPDKKHLFYPHKLCLVRHEAVNAFYELKKSQYDTEMEQKLKEQKINPNQITPFECNFNPDAFCQIYEKTSSNIEQQELDEVRDLSRFIVYKSSQLVFELGKYPRSLPIDGEKLTDLMHEKGINMRYLGYLYSTSETSPWKRCDTLSLVIYDEMVIRAMKNILRKQIETISAKGLVGHCISHFLNNLFHPSKYIPLTIEELIKGSIFTSSDVGFILLTPIEIKKQIEDTIFQKYRFDTKITEEYMTTNCLSLLKGICKKIGIQLRMKNYNESVFTFEDVLSIYPITKSIQLNSTYAMQAYEHGRMCIQKEEEKQLGIELIEESVSIFETTLGPINLSTSGAYILLSTINLQSGDTETALSNAKKAIYSTERMVGFDDIDSIQLYMNLSFYEFVNGNQEKAIQIMMMISHTLDRILNERIHVDRALMDNQIGLMFQEMGNNESSIEYYQKALEINRKIYGIDHPITASSFDVIGKLYEKMNNFKSSLNARRTVYAYYKKSFGEQDQKTLIVADLLKELTVKAVQQAKLEKKGMSLEIK